MRAATSACERAAPPVAAFFTFIGSMGNIPLAAVLFGNGACFAGIMAFISSDLIVLPVLRIQAKYYGWPLALYILGIFLVALVGSALILHYGFALAGMLPSPSEAKSVTDRELFAVDSTLFLNIAFALVSVVAVSWKAAASGIDWSISKEPGERILLGLAVLAGAWLVGGLLVSVAVPGIAGET